MATGRGFSGKRLPLILAFGVLVAAAIGAGCKGFFPNTTLSSIAIQPTSPQLNVGQTKTLQAWGTFSDDSKSQITSGVDWSLSPPTGIATITGTGSATLQGVAPGNVTVTASSQGVSGTATATVIGNVTSMTVTPTTATVTVAATGVPFTFTGSPGPPTYITADNGGTLTVLNSSGTTNTNSAFSCTVGTDASGNPAEVCTATSGASTGSPYTIQMSYPTPSGGTATASATANISGT